MQKTDGIGSRWWKFDFHAHTPGSDDYARGDDALQDVQSNEWPERWLESAMQSGLDCVVVTDHNAGGGIDVLQEKNRELHDWETKPDWYRALAIFPGVEITVADSASRVHLLAVFDPECDSRTITGMLGACGITSGFGDSEQTSTTTSFVDTVEVIEKAKGIPIPAHIDGAKGLLHGAVSLTPELKKSLDAVFAAEFIDPHRFDDASPELKKLLARLAKVGGSDAHKPSEIGRYSSWIKMSRPAIEGLRLALFDHEFCVKNQEEDPNHQPDIFLSGLAIQSMRYCGRIEDKPFITKFHPHFNAIIGGRGAGKSTLLESIRIVSRRDGNLAAEAPRVKAELDKFMENSRDKGVMLDSTRILLEVHRHGKNYRLCWQFDGQGAVLEEQTDIGWQPAEPGDLAARFPITIFSQKQINELAANPRGLLEIIDRSPEVNRAEWQSRWEGMKNRFIELRVRKRERSRQLSQEPQILARLRDVQNDLRQYEEKGHGEILKQYQRRSQQKNGLPKAERFNELSGQIRRIVALAELPDFPAHLFHDQDETTAEVRVIHDRTAETLTEINRSLAALAADVDTLRNRRRDELLASKWFQAVRASETAYEELKKEYQENNSRFTIARYGEWVAQRNRLQQQLNDLDPIRKEIEILEKQIQEILGRLFDLRGELFQKRSDFIRKVVGKSDLVRMELAPFGDINTVEDEYRALLGLSEGTFAKPIRDRENEQGILWRFCEWLALEISESDLPQIISDAKSRTLAIAEGRASSKQHAFDNRLKKIMQAQPVAFDALDAWWPEDMLRVRYAKDPASGKFDDLEKGSAGQKAAAILAFLLSHSSEPLLIDQPEDDLDNALIHDLIVRRIHENKHRRQLIIVTHNPNIVVNGDAELVHALQFQGGQVQIDRQGGIEESDIREAICAIMEGGREAFEKRYRRITLEGRGSGEASREDQ
uniref:AAA domain-containing protein, putative AbiEii toxin, Type IV TA system n=1 Tax=Candidatus Kentrum sp. UNK TaxID=2126344 RepID=A0A451AZA4_9GAMM|nr:MAG: AAA domain-containing protein, putative AbiEii toxin, Type IV TA system [Candidatus Kentron sp. UNK]VFK71389.1 MAG: AAA domain-containing protein, putative AbiEii toxin, Type IV TA system [Candidatus Kentron sp. UNK]